MVDVSSAALFNLYRAGNVNESAEEEREFRLSEERGSAVEDLGGDALRRIEASDMRAALDNVLGVIAK